HGEGDVALAPERLEEGMVRGGGGLRDHAVEIAGRLVVVDAEEEVQLGTGRVRRARHSRPRSRWRTMGAKPCASRKPRSDSTKATERCLPPVQPSAMVRYALPSRWYSGRRNWTRSSSRPSSSRLSGCANSQSVTSRSRPSCTRSASTKCGLGRKRRSNTRSASYGRPCLKPKDTRDTVRVPRGRGLPYIWTRRSLS